VPAGGYVLHHAHTPHYDGVPSNVKEPVVIALFGIAPVGLQLIDCSKPACASRLILFLSVSAWVEIHRQNTAASASARRHLLVASLIDHT